MTRVAAVVLLMVATSGGVARRAWPDGPQAAKPARSFTDDDLARYRADRLREEGDPGPVVPPDPQPSVDPAPLAAGSRVPSASASVVLRDLNGTLPPETRGAAEAAGEAFVTFFEVSVEGRLVIPLRFFPEMEDYREHLARNIPGDVMWTGYFDPTKGEIVVGGGPDALAILIHEMNHFIVHRAFEAAPLWLVEGLAEYFEGAESKEGGLVVREPAHHPRRLAEWLEGDRDPDLRQLLAPKGWTSIAPGFAHEWRVRALSWSIVDFLMRDEEGRQTLHAFMARLEDHRGLHSLEALDRTFPGGAAAFERQWLAHVQSRAGAP